MAQSKFAVQLTQTQQDALFIKQLNEVNKRICDAIERDPESKFIVNEEEDAVKKELLVHFGKHAHGSAKLCSGDLNQKLTVIDLMFTVLCSEYAARHAKTEVLGEMAQSQSIRDLYHRLKYASVQLIKKPVSMPSMDELAAAVLFTLEPADVTSVQLKREMDNKPLGLGFNLGDPSNEYKGSAYIREQSYRDDDKPDDPKVPVEYDLLPESKERQEKDAKDQTLLVEEQEAQMALGRCYRMASRVWFELEFAQLILESFEVESKLPTEEIKAIDDWILSRIRFDSSETYKQRVNKWLMRQLTPLGAKWAAQSQPESQTQLFSEQKYFEMDDMQSEYPFKQWAYKDIFSSKTAFLDDAKHPLHNTAVLALFTSIFESTFQLAFDEKYVVFADQLSERGLSKICNPIGADILSKPLRLPLVVQLNREWYVHNWRPAAANGVEGCWYKCEGNIKQALMCWMWIVHTQFKGLTEMGVSLREQWLSGLFGFK
jgi:hypothetical protein